MVRKIGTHDLALTTIITILIIVQMILMVREVGTQDLPLPLSSLFLVVYKHK